MKRTLFLLLLSLILFSCSNDNENSIPSVQTVNKNNTDSMNNTEWECVSSVMYYEPNPDLIICREEVFTISFSEDKFSCYGHTEGYDNKDYKIDGTYTYSYPDITFNVQSFTPVDTTLWGYFSKDYLTLSRGLFEEDNKTILSLFNNSNLYLHVRKKEIEK